MLDLHYINNLKADEGMIKLHQCLGSKRWALAMMQRRPFPDEKSLVAAIKAYFADLKEADWREAFSQHPKIGDLKGLKDKFSSEEQSLVSDQDTAILEELKTMNEEYLKKFGFVFLVCATGKTAGQMLAIMKRRITNSRDEEFANAVLEQQKITLLRLEKLKS